MIYIDIGYVVEPSRIVASIHAFFLQYFNLFRYLFSTTCKSKGEKTRGKPCSVPTALRGLAAHFLNTLPFVANYRRSISVCDVSQN